MPNSWFFAIHEDTPEQEAANLMEHSASVLDISSDDDVTTKQRNEEQERGKENIPPLDFLLAQPRMQSIVEPVQVEPVKRPRLRKFVQDAMDEDRRPLGDLAPSEFYGEGCDASSYVTVDAGMERPSGLSKECNFSTEEPEKVDDENVAPVVEKNVAPVVDETVIPVTQEVVTPVVEEIITPPDEEDVASLVDAAVAVAA
jgi:hypothetical protein